MTDQSPSPYSGLIAELARLAECEGGVRGGSERAAETMRQSARAIRDLEAENARLREALEPFGKASDKLHSGYDDGIAAGDHPMSHVFVSDLRQARAALSGRAET